MWLGLGFLAVLPFALINGAALMRRLERAHAEVWNALGQPDFRLSTGFGPRLTLVRYVWSGNWRGLDEAVLRRHCIAALISPNSCSCSSCKVLRRHCIAALISELLLVALFALLVLC